MILLTFMKAILLVMRNVMKDLAEQMSVYEAHHRKRITKFTHFIGVPIIVLALMILFSWMHVSLGIIHNVSLVWIAVLALLVYYLYLDLYLGLVSAIFLISMTLLAQYISNDKFDMVSLAVFFLLFVCGWATQL